MNKPPQTMLFLHSLTSLCFFEKRSEEKKSTPRGVLYVDYMPIKRPKILKYYTPGRRHHSVISKSEAKRNLKIFRSCRTIIPIRKNWIDRLPRLSACSAVKNQTTEYTEQRRKSYFIKNKIRNCRKLCFSTFTNHSLSFRREKRREILELK